MSYIEKQNSNIDKLLNLIKENPELEIVPMVDSDLGGYEYSYYMGSWGSAEVDEVYHHDEIIYFRSDDEDELIERHGEHIFLFDPKYKNKDILNDEEMELVNKMAERYVENLPWEKVISVQINLP